MCFGKDDGPDTPFYAAPPPDPEFMDTVDEIAGVQSVVVTGPDGKKKRVKSRLPRSPEEEARLQAGSDLLQSAIHNMTQLYRYNPESAVDFAPFIEAVAGIDQERMQDLAQVANLGNIQQDIAQFKDMQKNLLDEEFDMQNRANEERLAHSGMGTSTYAAESRALMARNQALARQQGDINANVYGEQLAAQKLARNKEAFGLRELDRQSRMGTETQKYALAKEHEADMERRRQMAIEEQKNLFNVGSSIVSADLNKALANNVDETALNTFNSQATASMNRYKADIVRQQANYQNAMAAHQAKGPSFGEMAMGFAMPIVGNALGGMFGGGRGPSTFGNLFGGGGGGARVGMNTVGHMYRNR